MLLTEQSQSYYESVVALNFTGIQIPSTCWRGFTTCTCSRRYKVCAISRVLAELFCFTFCISDFGFSQHMETAHKISCHASRGAPHSGSGRMRIPGIKSLTPQCCCRACLGSSSSCACLHKNNGHCTRPNEPWTPSTKPQLLSCNCFRQPHPGMHICEIAPAILRTEKMCIPAPQHFCI